MSNQTEIMQAIRSLSPTVSSFTVDKGKITAWDNAEEPTGVKQPTDSEINAEVDKLKAEYDSQEYARKRQAEYAKLNQFEMQFDDQRDSTTSWVDAVNAIKSKFPKPTG